MHEVQFADGVLARIHARGGKQYDERAYLFVLAAIEYLQSKLDVRRHVSGAELAWACRDLARERFGLLARPVLEHWGVRCTGDLGAIVYALVAIELLSTEPGDKEADFAGVYEFVAAFDTGYEMSGSGGELEPSH
ncbi:MAG: Minf_1886 family protein [Gemmatimonadales bacterium]